MGFCAAMVELFWQTYSAPKNPGGFAKIARTSTIQYFADTVSMMLQGKKLVEYGLCHQVCQILLAKPYNVRTPARGLS